MKLTDVRASSPSEGLSEAEVRLLQTPRPEQQRRGWKRKSVRHDLPATATAAVKFALADGRESIGKLRARDISSGGISLMNKTFVYPGTKCVIVLPDVPAHTATSGVVRRCEYVDGEYAVGVEFSGPLGIEGVLRAFGVKASAGSV